MPYEYKFLVLDGETPKEWRPFAMPMAELIDQVRRRGMTDALPPTKREEHRLRFVALYPGKSGWNKISKVRDVIGFIIDASFPHGKDELLNLLYAISAEWGGDKAAYCKSLGFISLWFITKKPMSPQELIDLTTPFKAMIQNGLGKSMDKLNVLSESVVSDQELEGAISISVAQVASHFSDLLASDVLIKASA